MKLRRRKSFGEGTKRGRWTVIGPLVFRVLPGNEYPVSFQLARCDCGTTREVQVQSMQSGMSRSCGCLALERLRAATKHGDCAGGRPTRLYKIWRDMLGRTMRPSHRRFVDWGGRGVTVCPEWALSYVAFREWALANGYRDDLELDRIDNNGNYEPGNCRWATEAQQAENRRTTVRVEAFGETKPIFVWSRDPRCRVSYTTLCERLKAGWIAEQAIATPPRHSWKHVA